MGNQVLELNGHSLTLNDVVRVAREGCQVALDPAAVAFVERGAEAEASWLWEDRVVYGITTGFGDLASVKISPKDRRMLQENLLRSHACGVGHPYSVDVTRASATWPRWSSRRRRASSSSATSSSATPAAWGNPSPRTWSGPSCSFGSTP